MRKLTSVKLVVAGAARDGNYKEFALPKGHRVRLALRKQLVVSELEEIIDRLTDYAYFIAKHSDKENVVWPKKPALRKQIQESVYGLYVRGYELECFLRLGADVISTERLTELANPEYIYDRLWIPGHDRKGFTEDDLDGTFTGVSVCGVFLRYDEKPLDSIDRKLILLNMPFDSGMMGSLHVMTQVKAIEGLVGFDFDPVFEKAPVSYRDSLSMYLMAKNSKTGAMPYTGEGVLAFPELRRRKIYDMSMVGASQVQDGILHLGGTKGDARWCRGVSLLVGLR
ncbi:hypothetical protein FWF93_02875 [Candidatus Saccharibacteria bacterium]|jgi:hypothetical protein|nr:hypothetical protein [Candidatus Saccharibacteria bacterium]